MTFLLWKFNHFRTVLRDWEVSPSRFPPLRSFMTLMNQSSKFHLRKVNIMPFDQLGSIGCRYNVKWQHLSQMKDVPLWPFEFFQENQNTTGYIWDQCRHLQGDGTPL